MSLENQKNSIIQFIKLSEMFPFYYPFDCPNFMPSFVQPYSDPSALFQYFSHSQELIPQETIAKKEQNPTNYSINTHRVQEKQVIKVQTLPILKQDFSTTKARKSTKYKKIKKVITDSNSFKIKIKESKQGNLKLRYTHKNFESNIINKIFSFLWSEDKSRSFINQILKDKAKVSLYYDFIKIVRKYCKRYINKEYLLALCDYNQRHIAYKIVTKQTEKLKFFTMQEFSETIRRLIFVYLNSVCNISILTSKKMRTDIWREHFEKMRNIKEFMFYGLSSEEYDQRMNFSYSQIYNRYQKEQKDQKDQNDHNEIEHEI